MSSDQQEKYVKGTAYKMESVCMKCFEQGETRFLYTEIPFYKEIILSSFTCDRCGHRDIQITSAAELAPKAITYTLSVNPILYEQEEVLADLSRTIVRTDSTVISIPELGFEIPANRSEINTVEGLLLNIRESLGYEQDKRKLQDPAGYEKIAQIIEKFEQMGAGEEPFTLKLYDPAGHCFVSNPSAPEVDNRCKVAYSERSREEYVALGFAQADVEPILTKEEREFKDFKDGMLSRAIADVRRRENRANRKMGSTGQLSSERGEGYKTGGSKSGLKVMSSTVLNKKELNKFETLSDQATQQLAVFPQTCSACRSESETRMCIIEIPYFGEAIIMCSSCQRCGFKDTEVKSSQAYGEKGIKISVHCKTNTDLTRDVLKSADSSVEIPELGLVLPYGVLGARFTSIEGILQAIQDHVGGQKQYYTGDSESGGEEAKIRVLKFLNDLENILDGVKPFTFILDDPAGNSFIEGRVDNVPDTSPFEDSNMVIEYYTRTEEQNDALGVQQMNTKDFETIPGQQDSSDDEDDDDDDDDEDSDSDSDSEAENPAAFGPKLPGSN